MLITTPADIYEPRPQLLVVIDTEEEFDWTKPMSRNSTSVTSMQHIDRVQSIFDAYAITPCYVVDYPIVNDPVGCERLREILADGRCEIGTHLHPWVNPPFKEAITPQNTFAGNLPASLEAEKIRLLTDKIAERFSQRPVVYKAGRYGIGPNTMQILADLGYKVDVSWCPPVDYRDDGGPDFTQCHADPSWYDQGILEIPVTGAFVGWLANFSVPVYRLAAKMPAALRATGILARSAAVDRLMLSPEGFTSEEHKNLTRELIARGSRVFTWSFHSPSVTPGMTPYVRNETDLKGFLDRFHRFFDYFFNELGGIATSPTNLWEKITSGAGSN